MEKYINLAKKLKVLAEKGIGGEKLNAEKMLNDLMKKHGFTIEDIEREKVELHHFKVKSDERRFFSQIVSTVLGKECQIYIDTLKKGYMAIETTTVAAIEIEYKFNFYLSAYKKQLETFYLAFLQVNNLFPKENEEDERSELDSLKKQQYLDAMKLAKSMNAEMYFKTLKFNK